MQEKDKLKDFLNQSYTGYEPSMPENDWGEFHVKLSRKVHFIKVRKNIIIIFAAILIVAGIYIGKQLSLQRKSYIYQPSREQTVVPGQDKLLRNIQSEDKIIQDGTVKQENSSLPVNSTLKGNQKTGWENPVIQVHQNNLTDLKAISAESINEQQVNRIDLEKAAKKYEPLAFTGTLLHPTARLLYLNDISLKFEPGSSSLIRITPKIFRPYFMLRLFASPGYNFPSYEVNRSKQSQVHENYTSLRNDADKGVLSFSGGLNLDFNFTGKISVTSGLVYRSVKSAGTYKFIKNRIPVVDSATRNILGYITVPDTSEQNFRIENQSGYLEIPLVVNYKLFRFNNISFGIKGGGSFIYLLNSTGNFLDPTYLNPTPVDRSRYNKTNMGILLGLNMTYDINQWISVEIEPAWNRFAKSVFKENEIVDVRPWNLSVKGGIVLKL